LNNTEGIEEYTKRSVGHYKPLMMKAHMLAIVVLASISVSGAKIFLGNSDKQAENRIMPLMKGFPSKHRVKEEKEAIKNSGEINDETKEVDSDIKTKTSETSDETKEVDSDIKTEKSEINDETKEVDSDIKTEKSETADETKEVVTDIKTEKSDDEEKAIKKDTKLKKPKTSPEKKKKKKKEHKKDPKKHAAIIGRAREPHNIEAEESDHSNFASRSFRGARALQYDKDLQDVQLWKIDEDDNNNLICKADGVKPIWPPADEKFETEAIKESKVDENGEIEAVIILNNAAKELALEVTLLDQNPEKAKVEKIVKMVKASTNPEDKRNKWFVTRHHIEKIDWFTLKSAAYGYFLTCPQKASEDKYKKLFVNYEVPVSRRVDGDFMDTQLWLYQPIENDTLNYGTLASKSGPWIWGEMEWSKENILRGLPGAIISVDETSKKPVVGSTSQVIATDDKDIVTLEDYPGSQVDPETMLWKVGEVFNDHYFTIKQYKGAFKNFKATGKYLTANGDTKNPTLITKQEVTLTPHDTKIWKAALWNFVGDNIVSKTGINLCTDGNEKYCEIPNVGTEGGHIIRDSDVKVLGISPDLTIAEWEIKADNRPDQIWQRSPFDPNNCFTLTNNGKMLHGLRGSYKGNRLNNGQPNMPTALWKFGNNKFTNKNDYKLKGEFKDIVTTEGNVQNIKTKTGDKVLGFEGVAGTVTEGTEVNLEEEHAEQNMPADNQNWIFNRIDNDPTGFFTITSVKTQMLLHGNSEGDAFVGYELFSPPLDYKNGPKSAIWHYHEGKLSNEKEVVLSDIMELTIDEKKNEEILQIQEKTTNNFFGLKDKDDVTKGSFVDFYPKVALDADDDHQNWIRTFAETNAPGIRFMLMNKKSKEYLHADWHGYFTNGLIIKTLEEVAESAQWIEKDGKITNKKTKKDLCTETCTFPNYGKKGYIMDDVKVMSLKGGETKKGTEVILETKVAASDKQHWTRSRPTSDGYFTLQSAATAGGDLYLASMADGTLTNGMSEAPEIPPNTPKAALWKIDGDKLKNGNGKKGSFEDFKWVIPDEGKIDLITKKDSNGKTVLALKHPFTNPILVEVKEKFVPSQQRYKVTMQKWERSRSNVDGHFVLRNIDPDAITFSTNTLLYANDRGMSIGKEIPKITVPVPEVPKTDDGFWKIEANKLTSKNGTTIAGNWTIAFTTGEGYIHDRDNSTRVLGLKDVKIDEGKVIVVEVMDKVKPKRAKFEFEGTNYQKWTRTEDDSGNFFALRNMVGVNYFLYANEFGMSVIRALKPGENTTPKPPTPKPTTNGTTLAPTGGADSKTIKISAIFIQLLLLAELLMM